MNFDCGEDGGTPSAVARAQLAVQRRGRGRGRGRDARLALAVNASEGATQQFQP